jgi:hypothetical protein
VVKISRCSAVTACSIRTLTSRSASATLCSLGPRDQRRQTSAARGSARPRARRRGRCRSAARQAAAGPHRALEQLVTEQPVGRVKRLGGAEQLLLAASHSSSSARAPLDRRRAARAGGRSIRRHGQPACAGDHRHVEPLAQRERRVRSSSAGSCSRSSASGSARSRTPWSSANDACSPSTKTWSTSSPPAMSRSSTWTPSGRQAPAAPRSLQPVLGDRRDRAGRTRARVACGERARRRRRARRSAPAPAAARPRRPGRRTAAAAQPEALDQPVHVEIGAHRVDLRGMQAR